MMSISPEQEALIDRVFEAYLTDHHHSDILQLIADTNEETHHPVVVNAMTLFEANMEVGDYFNAYPNDVLAIFNKVLNRKAMGFSNNASTKHVGSQRRHEQQMRRTLHARITGLPVCPELTRDTIPRTRDVGHFLSVTGTVIRTSVAKVLEYERDYMCTKCRHVFTVQADFEQFYTFVPPVACPSPDGCNSYKFSCLSGGSEPAVCRDYQEIKIQEQVQRLSVGSIPRSVVVVLEDDLVDSCKSGDDVTVYGVMCLRWKPFYDGTLCDVELVLKANNIEVNNQQAAAALLVKDAQKEFEDFWNSYKHDPIAGECHMLLVGDPGTGKSQFLKYAAKIMSRSVLTAGIGSTSAGLTVAAVKDGGEWHLEAGALVLSDGGLCCIDEFNSIKEHDRISIHEAMEQQSISVAKAGIVCKLNTRTTILAATNPKGQYDPNEPLSVNVALASPLLSRFDLVLVLLDTRNAEWDRIISSFILEDRDLPTEFSSQWSMDKMKAYFSVIKQLQPQVSDEANCILTRYYQLQRQSDGRNAARTTIRMLESLSRLAEAHARLMYRETVTIEDAVIAVSVMECSMQGGALLGNVNALLTSFPADPDRQYQTQCQILLEGLNLPQLLQKEMDRLARLKSRTSKTSECDPPTPKFQHQFSGTNSKTQCSDITGNPKTGVTVKSGSFHTSPSPPSEFRSSSVVTSTQGTWNTKTTSSERAVSMVTKQPSCQNEEDTLRKTDSEVTVSKTTGATFWFDTEPKENLQGARNKNTKEKLSKSQEKIQKCEREKNETHPEASGCVVQSKHQQLHNDCGKGLRERVVSRAESKNVRDDDLVQENLSTHKRSRCVKENKRDQAGANNSSAVFRENMAAAAEADTDLHAKLSGFMFKPKKMRPLVNNHDIISSPEKEMNMEMKAPKLINHDESAFTHTETQNQENFTSDVGESGSKGSTHSTSKASGRNSFSFRKVKVLEGTVGRKNGRDDTDNVRERAGATDDSNTETFLCPTPPKPSSDVTHQTTLKSGHKTTAVTSSTLAKLSRFSFACTGDPTAAQENGFTAAQEKSATDTVAKCKVKQTAFSHGANSSNHVKPDMVGSAQRTASLKRKCFELSPLGSISGGLFSGSSLFASTELNSDVLDTDWDQEVSKRARV